MASQRESREYLLGRNISLDAGLSALIDHLYKTEEDGEGLSVDYRLVNFISGKLGEILDTELSRLKKEDSNLATNTSFQAGFQDGKERLTNLLPSRPI